MLYYYQQDERTEIALTEEIKNKEKSKPKYNMWQCSGFMIKKAFAVNEKKILANVLMLAALAVANNLVSLFIGPILVGQVESGVSPVQLILTAGAFTVAMMLVSAAKAYIEEGEIYPKITLRLAIIDMINEKCCRTSYPNIDDAKFKDMYNRTNDATNANDKATEAIWNTLKELITNTAGFVIYLVTLNNTDPVIIITVIITTVVGYFINKYLGGYRYRHRDEEGEIERKLSYTYKIQSKKEIAKDIRIFGMRPWLDEMFDKGMDAYIAFEEKANRNYIYARIADLVLAFMRNGIAYYYLINMVLNGKLTVAEFLLYFGVFSGFTSWISGILSGFTTLYRQSLDISGILELIDYTEQFKFENGKPLNCLKGEKHEIRLENVSFRYPGANENTLENINLTINPGEKIAVVGLNGAGKTTLIKLICGFYDPTEGRVLLDGVDIREYNREDYYNIFSAVFQKFIVLPGSIALNVATTTDEIDMDRVKDCIAKAGLTEKIESLKDGYEAMLNREIIEDATELSGGETQRLILARALYKNAPFVVLDEPTAALDPIAEADIYNKYDEMTADCSSIYISHRLASTRFCDRVILVGEKHILEEGTHASLIKLGGKYAELFEVQSKYYREGENFKNE